MSKKIKYSFLIVIGILLTMYAEGQYPITKVFDIRSENIRPKISTLLTDNNGLIWLGTNNGVFNFNGISFKKITGTDVDSLGSVTALFEDYSGVFWVGYSSGRILKIKSGITEYFSPQEGLPKLAITGFAFNAEGTLFFSTKGEGVYCYYKKRLYNIDSDDGLSDEFCYTISSTTNGKICVGTDAGLNIIDFKQKKKSVKVFNASEGLPDDIVRAITNDGNGNIWIGMQDRGVCLFDPSAFQIIKSVSQWNYGAVSSIALKNNELYISTEKGGLIYSKDGETFEQMLPQTAKQIKINDLTIDKENNIWFCESTRLTRTTGNKLRFYSEIDNINLKNIHCITHDNEGNLWLSPDKYILKINQDADGKLESKLYKLPNHKDYDIVTLYFDSYGYLWAGTLGSGVYRINTKTGTSRKVIETTGIESSSILSITGNGENIWIGGFNGVMKMKIASKGNQDNAEIVREDFKADERLINDYVYSIFIDSKKRVWFGTDGNGCIYEENGILKNVKIAGNTVHSFAEDKNGRIWISTAEAGIFIWNKGNLQNLSTSDGLSDPSISSMICTENNQVILLHDNGFDVVEANSLQIIYHSSEDNLNDIYPDPNVITSLKDGSIYFGTEKGLYRYLPKEDISEIRPEVVITGVSLFLDPLDTTQMKKLSYDENNLRFDYTGIWFTDPVRLNYSYMLEGFSKTWETTKDLSITFPKLPPGNYTFRIKASLNKNFEGSAERTISFTIASPFWQRWWFRLLVAASITVLIIYIIKRREKNLLHFDRLQKEKIEFQFETLKNQVNPHFLFNSFNTLITVIEDSPEHAVEYVEKLSEFFRSIVNYRDQNTISLKDEMQILSNYIYIQKQRYGENLKLQIDVSTQTMNSYSIPPLTLQLLAENAVKHNAVSKETPLYIKISGSEYLSITNNINSKITKEKSSGLGLQNIVNRFKLLTDKQVVIENNDREFTVIIPLIPS